MAITIGLSTFGRHTVSRLKVLKKHPRVVFTAACKAQSAADWAPAQMPPLPRQAALPTRDREGPGNVVPS